MPELPQEFVDLAANNPEGFAEAMGSGMEAMTAAIGDGATIADAFEAMGDAMGPMMEDMGISPEIFDAAGDAVGAAIGPAMHMAPADASPADMGAMMQDGLDMMTPEGVDVPAPIMDAMGDMGSAMGDAGMAAHDVGAEMMGDPGSDTYMLPVDLTGAPVVEPGQPETCPAEACQAPPLDGACASTDMMPPEGGYDHAPINDDVVMPEPYDVYDGSTDQIQPGQSFELNADGSTVGKVAPDEDGGMGALDDAMAIPDPTGEIFGSEDIAPMDTALNSAMDANTEQGGGSKEFPADFVKEEEGAYDVDPKEAEDDGSAGMS
jgi:hypothetical protein